MASCLSPLQAIAEDWLVVDNGDSSTAVIAEFEILSLGNESVAVKDGKSNDPQVPKKGSLPLKSRLVETLIDAQVGVAEITETLSYHSANDCTVNFKFPVMPKTQILGYASASSKFHLSNIPSSNFGDGLIEWSSGLLRNFADTIWSAKDDCNVAVLI